MEMSVLIQFKAAQALRAKKYTATKKENNLYPNVGPHTAFCSHVTATHQPCLMSPTCWGRELWNRNVVSSKLQGMLLLGNYQKKRAARSTMKCTNNQGGGNDHISLLSERWEQNTFMTDNANGVLFCYFKWLPLVVYLSDILSISKNVNLSL